MRLSNKQNLLFVNIPTANLEPLAKALTAAGLNPHASLWRQSLVTCTGAQFCNLALTETKTRAAQILRFLEEHCPIDSPIFLAITGCPNACAHYQIADIGLTGVLCNFHGTPRTQAFNIFLGGSLNTPPKFATLALRKVPADFVHKAIQQLITAYHSHRLTPTETFRQFLARHPLAQLTQWLTLPEMAQVQ
ncbi:MAG: hypothetical protein FWD61_09740 [Phycisphaerales bacterium]|nr:hypothetical protein [Phycisphaerales bacterium]